MISDLLVTMSVVLVLIVLVGIWIVYAPCNFVWCKVRCDGGNPGA